MNVHPSPSLLESVARLISRGSYLTDTPIQSAKAVIYGFEQKWPEIHFAQRKKDNSDDVEYVAIGSSLHHPMLYAMSWDELETKLTQELASS